MKTYNENIKGFTIVEIIVTLTVLSIFLAGFFQAYLLMTAQRVKVARQAAASDIAYTNLRKVIARPAGLTCNASTGHTLLSSTNGTDDALRTFRPESDANLVTLRSQTVIAYPTAGCAGSAFTDNPVKIVSTVTFDANSPGGAESVVHASFIP